MVGENVRRFGTLGPESGISGEPVDHFFPGARSRPVDQNIGTGVEGKAAAGCHTGSVMSHSKLGAFLATLSVA